MTLQIGFYGQVHKKTDEGGKTAFIWEPGEMVKAVAYDVPIPGFATPSTNNLRLWSSEAASEEFDFQRFNSGEYESAVAEQQRAETISAVLYPNDNLDRGKELRLKQQYFWVAASLYDIVRRFKKSRRPWKEFPDQVAIQLNDTHPTLAVVELQRILVDLEGLDWDDAWNIVVETVSFPFVLFSLTNVFFFCSKDLRIINNGKSSSDTPITLYYQKLWKSGLSASCNTSSLAT